MDAIVGLADAIEALRAELSAAMAAGSESDMRFRLDPIELTLQVVITRDGHGKIGWKILEFGASYDKALTQTLTVKLTPLWKTSEGTLVEDFTIASLLASDDHFGATATG